MPIAVKIEGLEKFEGFIKKLGGIKTGLPKLYGRIGFRIINELVEDRFNETKTDPEGRPWQALSPKYKQKKIQKKGNEDILKGLSTKNHKSGALQESIGFQTKAMKLLIGGGGADVAYFSVHQEGSPAKNIPARPMVGYGKEEEMIVKEEVERLFMEMMKK